jgi:hypothetical protein
MHLTEILNYVSKVGYKLWPKGIEVNECRYQGKKINVAFFISFFEEENL